MYSIIVEGDKVIIPAHIDSPNSPPVYREMTILPNSKRVTIDKKGVITINEVNYICPIHGPQKAVVTNKINRTKIQGVFICADGDSVVACGSSGMLKSSQSKVTAK